MAHAMPIRLRPATASDCEKTFEWRNEPWIVSLSASQKRVERGEHEKWYQAALRSPTTLLFVICDDDGQDMGTVRVEQESRARALITVYLLREFTGRSYGVAAIRQASNHAFEQWPYIDAIHALTLAINTPSISAFSKAGFSHCPYLERVDTREFLSEMRLHRAPGKEAE